MSFGLAYCQITAHDNHPNRKIGMHTESTPIRMATTADTEAMLDIYAHYVKETTASFEEAAPSLKTFQSRIVSILSHYPWLVFEVDGVIKGYAYAGKFSGRSAYRWSTETTVYVGQRYQREGIGRQLYTVLFEYLKQLGYYNVYAGVTLPNDPSVGLHKAMGFTEVGIYKNVGFKHNEWRDVMWLQRPLNAATESIQPSEPKRPSEL